MRILLDQQGAAENLAKMLTELDADPTVASILVLACDENGYTPASLDGCLQATRKPLFGGVFPQILHERAHYSRGCLAVGLPFSARIAVIDALSTPERDFEADIALAFVDPAPNGTMFVFVDGFASHIGALIDGLYSQFGLDINYLGGGGGSLSLQAKPCVISNQGLCQDCVVLALTGAPSGIGVAHGWSSISKPCKVTESEGNVIRSLDWRPAFAVYREEVEAHSGRSFDQEAFFSLAKAYPFGVAKLDAEMVVRDPLMARDQDLVCVGEVRQSAFVHILHGDRDSLLSAAAKASEQARASLPMGSPRTKLFVDCVSRVLFLEDDFPLELGAVNSGDLPLIGALTLGEIANNGHDYLEFYNKTSVVGVL